MKGRGFAAILAIVLASVTLIASGGAGAQSGNEFVCTGTMISNDATAQNCEITASTGKCIEHSTSPVIVQTCTVNQTGPSNNEVVVDQANNSSVQGPTQTATQITTITQQGTTNRADVSQDIRQTSHESGGSTQKQDGRQVTTICQGGAGTCASSTNTGTNVAGVVQSRWADAHASGGTILSQLQDTDTVTAGKPPDCDTDRLPSEPDLCARIVQNSTTRNDATLHQDDHLLAEASESITQTQGSGDGGIDGHAMQQTISGTPQNTEDAHQHLTYDLSGPATANQTQDPRIGGGTGGKLNVHQVGILRASSNDAEQALGIDGICGLSGDCLILESAKINGANFSSRCSSNDGCTMSNIQCYSGEGEAFCDGFPGKGKPPEDFLSLGFDTSDFQDALNFTFPVSLPGL
jgi:hypothetical protein